jgi:hypothetical protein
MANPRVRHASISLGGKRIAECFRNKLAINPGDEPQFADDGFYTMSDGATTMSVDFDTIVPVAGMGTRLNGVILSKQDVDVTMSLIDGQIVQNTMRFTKAEYDSDAKTGTLNGSFTLMGGVPTLT